MSRIDAFSDVVFGFAITLLVVSLEVPKTFNELRASLLGFVPFAICFTFLLLVWHGHYIFFRRYNLHDSATIAINGGLLFVILFYVYPLKFLWYLLFGGHNVMTTGEDLRLLMLVYGAGYSAIYISFSLLYWRAWSLRTELDLNALELLETRASLVEHLFMAAIGILSCAAALLLPAAQSGNAGSVYLLVVPLKFALGSHLGKKRRTLVWNDLSVGTRTPH